MPQYKGALAFILDGVLSQEECDTLIKLAEQSTGIDPEKDNPWQPAMINGGIGYEFLDKTYRNSDRIIWDNPDLVSRLWQRCLQAEGIQEKIGELSDETHKQVLTGYTENTKWVVTKQGWNERMRFLKYSPGQFFKRKFAIRATRYEG